MRLVQVAWPAMQELGPDPNGYTKPQLVAYLVQLDCKRWGESARTKKEAEYGAMTRAALLNWLWAIVVLSHEYWPELEQAWTLALEPGEDTSQLYTKEVLEEKLRMESFS